MLIVDDSTVVRRALAQQCASLPQIEVVGEAKDGLEGLDAIHSLHPHALTLDIHMPKMDGIQVLMAIKEEKLDCSVIVVSGAADAIYRRKCIELGAKYVFEKTTEFEEVMQALQTISTE